MMFNFYSKSIGLSIYTITVLAFLLWFVLNKSFPKSKSKYYYLIKLVASPPLQHHQLFNPILF